MLIYQTGYKQISGIMISKCETKCAVQVIKKFIFIKIYCRWIPEIKIKITLVFVLYVPAI